MAGILSCNGVDIMAKIHEVKLHTKYLDLVLEGKKRAEFLKNHRNYESGGSFILYGYTRRKVKPG